jgi:hypothetical protein
MQTKQSIERLSRNPILDEDDRANLADYEEKLHIYSSLLTPLKRTVLLRSSQVYVPRSYGFLSRMPWYDFLRDWLCKFAQIIERQKRGLDMDIVLERLIRNIVYEIPTPPPGKLEVTVSISDTLFYLHRPPVNSVPLLKNVRF